MRYVTSWERKGFQKGFELGLELGFELGLELGFQKGAVNTSREAVVEILKTRFSAVPKPSRS
jgi:flagellar biosynthesis/type III secretory pathway protein FliH